MVQYIYYSEELLEVHFLATLKPLSSSISLSFQYDTDGVPFGVDVRKANRIIVDYISALTNKIVILLMERNTNSGVYAVRVVPIFALSKMLDKSLNYTIGGKIYEHSEFNKNSIFGKNFMQHENTKVKTSNKFLLVEKTKEEFCDFNKTFSIYQDTIDTLSNDWGIGVVENTILLNDSRDYDSRAFSLSSDLYVDLAVAIDFKPLKLIDITLQPFIVSDTLQDSFDSAQDKANAISMNYFSNADDHRIGTDRLVSISYLEITKFL